MTAPATPPHGAAGSGPAVISLGQIIVDLTMRVDAVPRPGGDVFADDCEARVGAGYNMLHAVRRMGVAARHGGVLGTGRRAELIEGTLRRDGIAHVGARSRDEDNGFCIAMTDAAAERTFVSVRGAEAHAPADAFDGIEPADDDVVYVSGYTLAHPTARALLAFLRRTAGHRFAAVFDASPMIARADGRMLRALLDYRPIWTCNEREAGLLAARLGVETTGTGSSAAASAPHGAAAGGGSGDAASVEARADATASVASDVAAAPYRALADALGAPLVVRVGAGGAWVCDGGTCTHVPGFPVEPVDTNGAGDCHTGVLCACLARGEGLADAVRTANAAAAIAVTRRGPATCPTREEIDCLLATIRDDR